MSLFALVVHQVREVPEYILALKGAVAVLVMGLPIYAGLRYFLHRRRLKASSSLTVGFVGVFLLYAGLAFLLASPLAGHIHGLILKAYLFLTCLLTALTIVEIIDLFMVQHYLVRVQKTYVSPPLRTVIKLSIFCLALLPILRFVLHFNPLALVAIPTIASAGIAFALQDTLKAFIAGVGLGNMIRLGEWIAFQDKEGRVVDINWARTTLETLDGQRIYIPNNLLLSGVFLNYTTGNPSNRQIFQISASYDANPSEVKNVLLQCAHDVSGIASSPPPQSVLLQYADSGIVYGLYYWVNEYSRRDQVRDEVSTRAWFAFRRAGIGIPYPTRSLFVQKGTAQSGKPRSNIEDALQQWTLAEAFYFEELKELSQWTKSQLYAPGEVIVRQGDVGQSLFTIVSGKVGIFAGPASDRPVASLGPREIFGEMSLLTGEPRAATVKAETYVELLEIGKNGLQKVIARRPELSDRLAELVSRRQAALAALPATDQPGPSASAPADPSLARRIRQFFGLA